MYTSDPGVMNLKLVNQNTIFIKWKELTSDKDILQIMLGLKLEFLGGPSEKHNSYIPQFSKKMRLR